MVTIHAGIEFHTNIYGNYGNYYNPFLLKFLV